MHKTKELEQVRITPRIVVSLLVVILINTSFTYSQGDELTGATIIGTARGVVTQLQNLGASLSGDVMIATNNGATQLSTATDHLEKTLHNQVNVPVSQLNGTIRDEALLLNSLVTQINTLMDRQRACLFAQADVFVAGLNTAIATLKSGVPLVSAGGPTVTSFQFDGHLTPNVVPRDGGAFVVKGFHLWSDGIPPRVAITDASQKTVLSQPQPSRGPDDNSYRIALDPSFVSQHAGTCVYISTVPRERKRFIGIPVPGGSNDLSTVVFPMCVPQATTTKVRLTAQIAYDAPTDDRRALDPWQNFRFDNPECNHHHSVSMTKGWTLPDGYSIVSIESRRSEQRNDNNNIQFSFSGNTITASGDQDSPSCVSGPFGIEKLLHTAIWSYDARPVIAGTAYPQKTTSAKTDLVDVVIPATQLCTSLEKLADAKGRKTSVNYTITPIISGKEAPSFSSAVYTTNDADNTYTLPNVGAFGGQFSITGTYNPNPVAGKCQVCVTLTELSQCGF